MIKDINFLLEHYSELMTYEEKDNIKYLSYELTLEDGYVLEETLNTLNNLLRRFGCQYLHTGLFKEIKND